MKTSLVLICLLLAGLIYYLAMHYPQINNAQDAVPPSLGNISVEEDIPNKVKPLRAYAEIIRRPLFALDRKPPAVQNSQIEESIDIGELENLVLFGVVISGATKYAIVGNRKAESTEQIKEGHRYKGWRVSAITSDSIKFVGTDAQYELFISPNDTTKKSGLRNAPPKTPTRGSIFKSLRKKGRSPINIPIAKPTPQVVEDLDDEELEALGDEGGYEFDLDAEFDDEEFEE